MMAKSGSNKVSKLSKRQVSQFQGFKVETDAPQKLFRPDCAGRSLLKRIMAARLKSRPFKTKPELFSNLLKMRIAAA
jgi:hypothetical protein